MINFFQRIYRRLLFEIMEISRTMLIRCNYAMDLRRIRHKHEPINVLFLVCDISKWKSQSLYDLMAASKDYRPKIGIVMSDFDNTLGPDKLKDVMAQRIEYFQSRNMPVRLMFDEVRQMAIELCEFKPDVVFYPYQWGQAVEHSLQKVSYFALTCYIPYYVQFQFVPEYDCTLPFHRDVWCQITQSEGYARSFRNYRNCFKYAGRVVGLGHPALDYFHLHGDVRPAPKKTVIYAPHWSFDHPGNVNFENYSTFLWTGQVMLDYARAHPEIRWVFKPHPTLKISLIHSGAMSGSEVDAYWQSWRDVGEICETGDYQRLFLESSVMITDCCSFLSEYGATGRPLIRIISPTAKLMISDTSPCFALNDSFYLVHDLDELRMTLLRVIERGDDYKREERMAALEKSGLRGIYAAKNIMKYFNQIFCREVQVDKQ